jgi:hypothetical protein
MRTTGSCAGSSVAYFAYTRLYPCSPVSAHGSPTPTPEIIRRAKTAPPLPEQLHIPRPTSLEGSIIPGETEEDGLVRREYVLVDDTRAVEFNRTVDGPSKADNLLRHTF